MSPRADSPEITILVDKALELVKDLGVHAITRNIEVIDMRTIFLGQFRLDLFELQRLHIKSRSTINPLFASDDVASERFGESTVRLSEVTLEELYDRRWEIELGSLVDYVLFGEIVGNHELGEITDDLGGRSDFDDISTESVRFNILLLDIDPLGTESKLGSLELQVGVLTTISQAHLGILTLRASRGQRHQSRKLERWPRNTGTIVGSGTSRC
jgi:hypothetical protein